MPNVALPMDRFGTTDRPAGNSGYSWLLDHYLLAIVRIRFAIRTYNSDSAPSPSPKGEGMSKPGCQTKSKAHICSLLPLREKGWG